MSADLGHKEGPQPTELEQVIGGVLKDWIKAAEGARKSFLSRGSEIMRYGFSKDYLFEYQRMNPDAWFKAKYGKTAEAFQVIVPQIAQATPFRLFTPRTTANPASLSRTAVAQDYSNYTTGQTNHAKYSRRATTDAVGYGRGVRWTGRHPKSGLVYSTWSSIRELLVDPNAKLWEDVHAVARERVRPKCDIARELMESQAPGAERAAKIVYSLATAAKRNSDEMSESSETSSDCVRYYEIYLDQGIQHLKGGQRILQLLRAQQQAAAATTEDDYSAMQGDETPLLYLVAESGRLISVQPWPIPFHLLPMDGWPCTVLDFYDNPSGIWPISMLDPGIGFQRAMNHIVTLLMGKFRYTCKTVLAVKKVHRSGLSQKDKDKITPRLTQEDVQAIEVEMGAGDNLPLKAFIEQFDYSQEYISKGLELLDALEHRFERLTGLTEFVSTGMSATQDRSAAGSQIKDRIARTRIEDMRDREAEHEATLARKEAFAARYLLDREDIGKVLGPQAAQTWGFLAQPEQMSMDYWITEALNKGITDPMVQTVYAQQMLSQAVDITNFPYEVDYSIDSASVRRKDIDRQLDLFKEYFNQTGSQQMVSMDPNEKAIAYQSNAVYWKLAGLPDEIVNANAAMADFYRQLAAQPPPLPVPPGEETEDGIEVLRDGSGKLVGTKKAKWKR